MELCVQKMCEKQHCSKKNNAHHEENSLTILNALLLGILKSNTGITPFNVMIISECDIGGGLFDMVG